MDIIIQDMRDFSTEVRITRESDDLFSITLLNDEVEVPNVEMNRDTFRRLWLMMSNMSGD